jgi:hypothetical protein
MVRFALAGALLLAACQDAVKPEKHYRVPQEAAFVPAAVQEAPAPSGGGLAWTLPAGWTQAAGGGQMRYATITPPGGGKAQVTVFRLPGEVGGELANVNRWRGQLGLGALSQDQLPSARKMMKTAAGDLAVYDFSSEGAMKGRTVAGFASVEGETWFLKLSGDASAVAAAQPKFLELLRSLRLEAR